MARSPVVALRLFAREVPDGPQWVHEIEQDGYRMICRRDGGRVGVFSRWGTSGAGDGGVLQCSKRGRQLRRPRSVEQRA